MSAKKTRTSYAEANLSAAVAYIMHSKQYYPEAGVFQIRSSQKDLPADLRVDTGLK